jgi:hypothetical protein
LRNFRKKNPGKNVYIQKSAIFFRIWLGNEQISSQKSRKEMKEIANSKQRRASYQKEKPESGALSGLGLAKFSTK